MWNDVRCGMVCCARNVVRCEILLSCGMYNTLPLHLAPITTLPPHFALHHSTSNTVTISGIQVTPHWFHITSSVLTITHISYHSTSCSTLFHFAIPYFKSHHIGHIMHHTASRIAPGHFTLLTYHIAPHSMYSMPHSDNAIYWPHSHASHHTLTQRCTAFQMLHILHHYTTSDWSHLIPHPTIMFRITLHISTSHSTSHYLSHLHNITTTTTYRAVSQPTLYLIPLRTTFHIACHRTRTNPYYTTTFRP